MWKRTLTGTALLLVMISAIWAHFFSAMALFLFICIASVVELYRLLQTSHSKPYILPYLDAFASLILFIPVWLCAASLIPVTYCLLAIAPLPVLIISTVLFTHTERAVDSVSHSIFGLIYVALPFSVLSLIALFPTYDANLYNPWYLLSFFILVWANDTGAYLAGKAFGIHKLFERISPKKTWEGSAGGLLLSLTASFCIWKAEAIEAFTVTDWISITLLVVIFGNVGDLTESCFKRSLHIKDSGGMLPGHGGLLDRFDGVLLSAPAVSFYLMIKYIL